MNNAEPAFPQPVEIQGRGMSLRDYFAIRAPVPTKEAVDLILRMEQQANPNNDSYKPNRRGVLEIECSLRYKWADEMLKARSHGDE